LGGAPFRRQGVKAPLDRYHAHHRYLATSRRIPGGSLLVLVCWVIRFRPFGQARGSAEMVQRRWWIRTTVRGLPTKLPPDRVPLARLRMILEFDTAGTDCSNGDRPSITTLSAEGVGAPVPTSRAIARSETPPPGQRRHAPHGPLPRPQHDRHGRLDRARTTMHPRHGGFMTGPVENRQRLAREDVCGLEASRPPPRRASSDRPRLRNGPRGNGWGRLARSSASSSSTSKTAACSPSRRRAVGRVRPADSDFRSPP
jgi:hypothetical protein